RCPERAFIGLSHFALEQGFCTEFLHKVRRHDWLAAVPSRSAGHFSRDWAAAPNYFFRTGLRQAQSPSLPEPVREHAAQPDHDHRHRPKLVQVSHEIWEALVLDERKQCPLSDDRQYDRRHSTDYTQEYAPAPRNHPREKPDQSSGDHHSIHSLP